MQIVDGRYRLVRRLGTGGMGAVYVAERLGDEGGVVALKVMHSDELSRSPALVKRFYREARATGALDTPHVVRVFDAGTDPESASPYMAMELLDGEDLHRFTKQVGAVDPDLALRITAQVCLGLAKAHEAGIVHRDIKAGNIFLARTGGGIVTVKLLDFGIAKTSAGSVSLDETAGHGLTRTGMVLGSPLYMSPEQARGAREVDHRSDLWSLGVMLFRLLAGRTPFQHVEGMGNIIVAICTSSPPPVQSFAPWVSPAIAAIVDRALRSEPGERYQSAAEMLSALRALLPADARITEDMLAGIAPARRTVVAPRFARPDEPALERRVEIAQAAVRKEIAAPSRAGDAAAAPTRETTGARTQAGHATGHSTARERTSVELAGIATSAFPPALQAPRASAVLAILGAAAMGALLTAGAFRLRGEPILGGAAAGHTPPPAPAMTPPILAEPIAARAVEAAPFVYPAAQELADAGAAAPQAPAHAEVTPAARPLGGATPVASADKQPRPGASAPAQVAAPEQNGAGGPR